MKYLFCLVCASLLLFACTQSTNNIVPNKTESCRSRNDTTLLDLFYGMDPDTGCVLDSMPGILKFEKKSLWRKSYDPYKYDASLCIYMDSVFPSNLIREQVMCHLDSLLQELFVGYCIGGIPTSLHDSINNCESSEDFSNYCSSIFDYVDNLCSAEDSDTLYLILPFRVALVACRVYNDEDVATYIFEASVDYNGSCGCPSGATYCTFDKKTGRMLGYDDFFVPESVDSINKLLDLEHCREYKKRYDSDYYEGHSIFTGKQECVALVKEGFLFYYEPYSIGCGAEGQYNLILTPEMTVGLRK